MKNNRLTNVEVKELTLIADRIKELASLKHAFFGKDEDSDKKIKEEIRLYMTWFDLQADKINRILMIKGRQEDQMTKKEAIEKTTAEKKLINTLIGSPLEICYHDDDGTEGAFWYIRGGEGGRTIAGCFETLTEAEKEYARLKKLIKKEIAGLYYELQR